eukprot:gene12989-14983_t
MDVATLFTCGKRASRSEFQKIFDVWSSSCSKTGVTLSNKAGDVFTRVLNASSKTNAPVLDLSDCQLSDDAVAKLVEVLAMRPLIVELDISGNTVSDKVLKLIERLLKGQAKLAKTVELDDRLTLGFLGHVNLPATLLNAEYSVVESIESLSAALRFCNAQSYIRSVYLQQQVMEPLSPSSVRKVWTGVFGSVDENEMVQAFHMARLLNKMDEMLSYEEMEAVFLCSFILRWFVTALDERQMEAIGFSPEWLVSLTYGNSKEEKEDEEVESVPVVELVLPDSVLFSPARKQPTSVHDISAIPSEQEQYDSAEQYQYDLHQLSRFNEDFPGLASPPPKKTMSLFTAKYLDKALKQSTPSAPTPRVPDLAHDHSHSSEKRTKVNTKSADSASKDSHPSEMYIRYDKISALQHSGSRQRLVDSSHAKSVSSASAQAPQSEHRYFEPNPQALTQALPQAPRRDHFSSSAHSFGEESTHSEETKDQQDLDTSLDRAMHELQEDLANMSTTSLVAQRRAEFEKSLQAIALSRHAATLNGVPLPGHTASPSKWGTPGQASVSKPSNSNEYDTPGTDLSNRGVSQKNVNVLTVCNPSNTDRELAEVLKTQRGPPVFVLILRNNNIFYPEQLDLPKRFAHLTDLDLSFNSIAGAVKGLPPTLQRLDLSHNRITNISSILHCVDLVEVNLSHNKIKSFQNLPAKLVCVDLSYNAITAELTLRTLVLSPHITSLDLTENPVLLERKDWRMLISSLLPGITLFNGKPTTAPPRKIITRESAAIAHAKTAPPPPPPLATTRAPSRGRSRGHSRSAVMLQRVNDTIRTRLHDQKFEQLVQARERPSTEVVSGGKVLKPKQVKALTQRLTTPTATALLKAGAPSPPALFSEKDLLQRKWAPPKLPRNEKYEKISLPAVPADAKWAKRGSSADRVEFYSQEELTPSKSQAFFPENDEDDGTSTVSRVALWESGPDDGSDAGDSNNVNYSAKSEVATIDSVHSGDNEVISSSRNQAHTIPAADDKNEVVVEQNSSPEVKEESNLSTSAVDQPLPSETQVPVATLQVKECVVHAPTNTAEPAAASGVAIDTPLVPVAGQRSRSPSSHARLMNPGRDAASNSTGGEAKREQDSPATFSSLQGQGSHSTKEECPMSAKERLKARLQRSQSPSVRTPSALTVPSSLAPSPSVMLQTTGPAPQPETKIEEVEPTQVKEAPRVPTRVLSGGLEEEDEALAGERFFSLSADDDQPTGAGWKGTSVDSAPPSSNPSNGGQWTRRTQSTTYSDGALSSFSPAATCATDADAESTQEMPKSALALQQPESAQPASSIAEPLELLISPPRHAKNSYGVSSVGSDFGVDSPALLSAAVDPASSKLSVKERLLARMAKKKV